MDTIAQIEQGILICPETKQRLHVSSDKQWLVTMITCIAIDF